MRLITTMLALTFALACGDSPTAVASADGTYTLKTINGQSLPFNLGTTGTTKFEVTSETLVISGGSYTVTTTVRQTMNGQASSSNDVETGTVTTGGSTVTFKASDGGVVTGTLSGSTITLVNEGFTLVFAR